MKHIIDRVDQNSCTLQSDVYSLVAVAAKEHPNEAREMAETLQGRLYQMLGEIADLID